MKILKTELITDENDVAVGINLDIEIEKCDAERPLYAERELQDWYDKIGARNKELATKGVGGADVVADPRAIGYKILIGIWKQYLPAESQRFEDVVFALADSIWKEARCIYGD